MKHPNLGLGAFLDISALNCCNLNKTQGLPGDSDNFYFTVTITDRDWLNYKRICYSDKCLRLKVSRHVVTT